MKFPVFNYGENIVTANLISWNDLMLRHTHRVCDVNSDKQDVVFYLSAVMEKTANKKAGNLIAKIIVDQKVAG